jgi:hypothetical protein
MVKVSKNGQMGRGIPVIGEMVSLMDKDNLIMQMVMFMKETLFTIKLMDLENMFIKMVKNILDFGTKIYNMEQEEKN